MAISSIIVVYRSIMIARSLSVADAAARVSSRARSDASGRGDRPERRPRPRTLACAGAAPLACGMDKTRPSRQRHGLLTTLARGPSITITGLSLVLGTGLMISAAISKDTSIFLWSFVTIVSAYVIALIAAVLYDILQRRRRLHAISQLQQITHITNS